MVRNEKILKKKRRERERERERERNKERKALTERKKLRCLAN